MNRLYILPMVAQPVGARRPGMRSPKYLFEDPLNQYRRRNVDYGAEDICLTYVKGITQVHHDLLVANSDVIGLPENLQAQMTAGQVTAAQAFMEGINIPAGWVNTSRTVGETVKILIGLFEFLQVWRGLTGDRHGSPFNSGAALNTEFNDLNLLNRSRLVVTMDRMNVDTTGLAGTSTIRDIMQNFAESRIALPFKMAGDVF